MSEKLRSTIELNIYDDDLNVSKTFTSYGLKWKQFKEIMAMQDELGKMEKNDPAAAEVLGKLLSIVFPSISQDDLDEAYMDDLWNCFEQSMNVADKIAKNL